MAVIDKRQTKDGRTTYRARVRLKGYKMESATFERLTDARKWIQQTEAAMREGRYFKIAEAKRRTVKDLINQYRKKQLPKRGKDKETVEPHLKWWEGEIGHLLLADVTSVTMAECRDKLLDKEVKGRKVKNATVVRYLASISVCFTYAIEDLGWLSNNPVRAIKKPRPERGRVRFLSQDERKRLLDACQQSTSPYLYPVVLFALHTGARRGEILNLRWKDIDLKSRTARFEDTKNGERRSVPLSQELASTLAEMNKVRRIDTDLVFPRADGKAPIQVKKYFPKAVATAELEDFRFHDLRHTAASYLAMSGATLVDIAQILGHKTMAMVKRYSHLTEQHTRTAVERMTSTMMGMDEAANE
jgi:integrase